MKQREMTVYRARGTSMEMPDVNALFGLEEGTGGPAEKVEEIAIGQLHPFPSLPGAGR